MKNNPAIKRARCIAGQNTELGGVVFNGVVMFKFAFEDLYMIYKEALEKFNTDNTVCIVVRTKDGLRALTENNFAGGCCGCCKNCDDSDDLIVEKIVDMETMEIFYCAT